MCEDARTYKHCTVTRVAVVKTIFASCRIKYLAINVPCFTHNEWFERPIFMAELTHGELAACTEPLGVEVLLRS
jgi:hypothetical protein